MEIDSWVRIKFVDKFCFLNLFPRLLLQEVQQIFSLVWFCIEYLATKQAKGSIMLNLLL